MMLIELEKIQKSYFLADKYFFLILTTFCQARLMTLTAIFVAANEYLQPLSSLSPYTM